MEDFSGVAGQMKRFSWLVIIVLLGSVGLPLTNGFIGEFLLLNGLYNHNAWYAAVAGLTLIFGAAYMLRLYRNVFLGEVNNEVLIKSKEGSDVSSGENWILIPLCILIIVVGVYPNLLLNISQPSVDSILQIFHQTTVTAAQ
jgi:NADH-quinone oxidoreductase subunit M